MWLVWTLCCTFVNGYAYEFVRVVPVTQFCPLYRLYTSIYEIPLVVGHVYGPLPHGGISRDWLYGFSEVGPYYKTEVSDLNTIYSFRNTNTTEEDKDDTEAMNTTTSTMRPPVPPPPRPPPPPLPKPPPLPPPPPPRPSPYLQPPLPLPPPPSSSRPQAQFLRPFHPPPPPPPVPQPSSAQPAKTPSIPRPPSYLPYLQPVFYLQSHRPPAV